MLTLRDDRAERQWDRRESDHWGCLCSMSVLCTAPKGLLHPQLLRSSLWRVNVLYVDCGVVACIHICDQGVHNYINKIISYSWLYFTFTVIMWKVAKRVHRQKTHRAFLCSTFEITWISVIISNKWKTNAGENLVSNKNRNMEAGERRPTDVQPWASHSAFPGMFSYWKGGTWYEITIPQPRS